MKRISILTPTYNESENVAPLCERIRKVMGSFSSRYNYEHIIIDNASVDNTVDLVKEEIEKDKHIKLIVNARNFGHIRSPYYGLLQCTGDAVICMASDLQDPPEKIAEFIEKWEQGYKVVIGVKTKSKENPLMYAIRKLFYNAIKKISETEQIKNFTGFGLYDRCFLNELKNIEDPYPYFRGLISEIGYKRAEIEFEQPQRERGKTKNNFYTLYDIAMLGFVNHSKLPLRLASFIGFGTAILSFLAAVIYFIYKLVYWDEFSVGTAPLVIGLFFFSSIQLFFIGIIGEYIGAIHTQVKKRPLVTEKERVNF